MECGRHSRDGRRVRLDPRDRAGADTPPRRVQAAWCILTQRPEGVELALAARWAEQGPAVLSRGSTPLMRRRAARGRRAVDPRFAFDSPGARLLRDRRGVEEGKKEEFSTYTNQEKPDDFFSFLVGFFSFLEIRSVASGAPRRGQRGEACPASRAAARRGARRP